MALPPGFPGGYSRYFRLLRPALRFLGPLGWLLTAYELYEWYMQRGDTLDMGGFIKCCGSATGDLNAYRLGPIAVQYSAPLSCSAIDLCGTGGQVPTGSWPANIPPLVKSGTSRYQGQYLYLGYLNEAGTRMTFVEGYKRVVASPKYVTPPTPQFWPEISPGDVPMPLPLSPPGGVPPWVEPMRPPLAPMPWPSAPPVRVPPILRPPERPEGSQSGNSDPRAVPSPPLAVNPSPAGPGVRERKVRAAHSAARRFLGWLTSAASEAGDLLDALYDALPEQYQVDEERPNYQEKLEALYNGWEHVNMEEAFENIWQNEVEDRYLGKFFEGVQDGMALSGVDFGGLKM